MNWRIRHLAVTESTNDDAKAAAGAGEPEGFVVHALQQTAGRGRHGRRWESPEGNLYCSVLLRPKTPVQILGQYSFVAALALRDTVHAFLPEKIVTLKWPNDVLVDGKKISGILLEAGDGWLVIGMGLNVKYYPGEGIYPGTSLQKELPHNREEATHALSDILTTLLDNLNNHYETMLQEGFSSIRTAWLVYAQKGPMTVKLPKGTVEGDFIGLDEEGNLCLRFPDGSERAIATGDVFPLLRA